MRARAHILSLLPAILLLMVMEGCKPRKSNAHAEANQAAEASNQFGHYFIDACTHYNNGNYDAALKLFIKCRDLKPGEASVYYELSRVYEKNEDKNLALQNAMKAFELAPANKYYALWYASKLRQNSQYDQAISVLHSVLPANSKDEPLIRELDLLYGLKGDTPRRISLWKNYQEATSYKLSTSLKLIELYKAQKDYAAAHKVYDDIKRASPGKFQYYIDDANLYLEHNDEANANLNFEKAVAINPNNWKVNYALYNSYRKKDKVKAGRYLGMAFADVNTSFESKINACVELKNESKTDTGMRYFTTIAANELVKLYPENANALITAAKFYEENENYRLAFDRYQAVYKLNPNMYDAWTGAIACAEKLDLAGDMASISEQALEYYPNVASLYLSAARAYNMKKEYRKAADHCTSGKSFALDNDTKCQLLTEEAFALFKLQDYNGAEKACLEAMAINKEEKQLYDIMGNVKYFLRQVDEAVKNWEKARDLGLKNPVIDRKISERKYYE